jgi:hypothetical protein
MKAVHPLSRRAARRPETPNASGPCGRLFKAWRKMSNLLLCEDGLLQLPEVSGVEASPAP